MMNTCAICWHICTRYERQGQRREPEGRRGVGATAGDSAVAGCAGDQPVSVGAGGSVDSRRGGRALPGVVSVAGGSIFDGERGIDLVVALGMGGGIGGGVCAGAVESCFLPLLGAG